jgi:hypothetical protein
MAFQESITGTPSNSDEPIACTLDSAGFATQVDRWTQVLARAVIEPVETEDGIRIHFRAGSGVEQELRELVGVESECCSWASWGVDASGDGLVLRVTSTGDGIAVIRAIFASQPLQLSD